MTKPTLDAVGLLATGGTQTFAEYEAAAIAVGRLDAAASRAEPGFRELLVLRCAATATGTSLTEMIALARAGREGAAPATPSHDFARALRDGSARARGGAAPSLEALHGLLMLPPPIEPIGPANELLRDSQPRVPAVLKAALVVQELEGSVAQLAVPLILCAGGAASDAWITLPPGFVRRDTLATISLQDTFASFAREARSSERALGAAHERCAADEKRVRNALGRAAYSALDVLALLRREIVITVPETARTLGVSQPTAGAAVERLVKLGIAREVTGKARLRAFAYEGMVAALAPSASG